MHKGGLSLPFLSKRQAQLRLCCRLLLPHLLLSQLLLPCLVLGQCGALAVLQAAWMQRYTDDRSQAYFVIETLDGRPLGTVRLYDAREGSFCWGSCSQAT